jgi:hypothetical protein
MNALINLHCVWIAQNEGGNIVLDVCSKICRLCVRSAGYVFLFRKLALNDFLLYICSCSPIMRWYVVRMWWSAGNFFVLYEWDDMLYELKIILVNFIWIKTMNMFPKRMIKISFPNACRSTSRQNVLLHLHLSYSNRPNTRARETYTFLDCSNAQWTQMYYF